MKQKTRVLLAVACVLVLLLAPVLSVPLIQRSRQAPLLDSSYAERSNLVEGLFDRISSLPERGSPQVSFYDEVLDSRLVASAQAFCTGNTIGLHWEHAQVSEETVWAELARHGWERIGTDNAASTCVKGTGEYQWMYVQFFPIGQSMNLVLTFRKE